MQIVLPANNELRFIYFFFFSGIRGCLRILFYCFGQLNRVVIQYVLIYYRNVRGNSTGGQWKNDQFDFVVRGARKHNNATVTRDVAHAKLPIFPVDRTAKRAFPFIPGPVSPSTKHTRAGTNRRGSGLCVRFPIVKWPSPQRETKPSRATILLYNWR